jgi:hypothetical protein
MESIIMPFDAVSTRRSTVMTASTHHDHDMMQPRQLQQRVHEWRDREYLGDSAGKKRSSFLLVRTSLNRHNDLVKQMVLNVAVSHSSTRLSTVGTLESFRCLLL